MSLWEFAVDRYERPGAKEAFLALQDEYGMDIPVLLFLLWVHENFKADKDELGRFCTAAIDEVKDWREGVIKPLREARRAAKENTTVGSTDYYETTKQVELEAEKRQLMHLERLAEENLTLLPLGQVISMQGLTMLIWKYFKSIGYDPAHKKAKEIQKTLDVVL